MTLYHLIVGTYFLVMTTLQIFGIRQYMQENPRERWPKIFGVFLVVINVLVIAALHRGGFW